MTEIDPAVSRCGLRPLAASVAVAAWLAGCAAPPAQIGASAVTPAPASAASPAPDLVVRATADGALIDVAEWSRRLRQAPVVLLGEVHDNRRHHALRASMLRIWAGSGSDTTSPGEPRPAIVFEYFDRKNREALLDQTAGPAAGRPPLESLLDTAGFSRKGWGWPAHRSLFEAAREVDASWIAAGVYRPALVARDEGGAKDGAKGGRAGGRGALREASDPAAKEPAALARAALDREALDAVVAAADWPEAAALALDQALVQGHCNQLPASMLPAMTRFQRSRDASLAQPVLAEPARRTLILAGNGHVGRVHGVPRYLGPLAARAITVGFVERAAGSPPGPRDSDRADYDWIVVTEPVADRDDPCKAFSPPAPTQTPAH